MIYNALEILSIIANAAALLTGLLMAVSVLIKSIHAKRVGITLESKNFAGYDSLFTLLKSCVRCGFVFQFLAWLMFSANQWGFIPLYRLTFAFAVLWAALCVATIVTGVAGRFIGGKEVARVAVGNNFSWYLFYAVVYFVATFLIY